MEVLNNLSLGLTQISWESLLFVVIGVVIGIVFGAMPGLTATTGVTVFLPVTFFMESSVAIAFLLGIYCGGIYGGSITAILINTPGTPSAACTTLDGYQMAKKGDARKALQMALYASVFGGLFSDIVLLISAPQIAKFAINFSAAEYFSLGVFGLTIVASLSSGNLTKGFAACCLGLFISFVGMDKVNSAARFTFGTISMMQGIDTVPCCIGFFALAELIRQAEESISNPIRSGDIHFESTAGKNITRKEWNKSWPTILKGSVIGTVIGAIPATGPAIAAFASYNTASHSSYAKDEFGTGAIDGVAAAESANNAVTGGALIPLLTLGIPGDVVTAVLLSALTIQGITAGPSLFAKQAPVVYGIFITCFICNIVMCIIGTLGINVYQHIMKVPNHFLQPLIFGLCVIGVYALQTRVYDVFLMMIFAVIGWLMDKFDFPVAPVILALILGSMVETYLRRMLTVARGSPLKYMLGRPISLVFWGLTIFAVAYTIIRDKKKSKT